MASKRSWKITGPLEASKRRVIQSSIAGVETIKAFSLEASQRREWRKVSSRYTPEQQGQISNMIITNVNATLTQLMTVAIVTTGVLLVLNSGLSAGAIISCNMLGGNLYLHLLHFYFLFRFEQF